MASLAYVRSSYGALNNPVYTAEVKNNYAQQKCRMGGEKCAKEN
jgi:hypothetical protein